MEGLFVLIIDRYSSIQKNPKFQKLVKRKNTFSWFLTAIILIVYFAFILIIAFYPKFLGIPVAEGMVTTIGIPMGLFIIIFSIILTGVYVKRVNGEFDKLTREIIEESLK